jgi:transposase
MPQPYSYDLGKKVIQAIKLDGLKIIEARGYCSTLVTGQVVVMDNATFHKGGRIQELIQSAGCRLLYLPRYSPDFNLH